MDWDLKDFVAHFQNNRRNLGLDAAGDRLRELERISWEAQLIGIDIMDELNLYHLVLTDIENARRLERVEDHENPEHTIGRKNVLSGRDWDDLHREINRITAIVLEKSIGRMRWKKKIYLKKRGKIDWLINRPWEDYTE